MATFSLINIHIIHAYTRTHCTYSVHCVQLTQDIALERSLPSAAGLGDAGTGALGDKHGSELLTHSGVNAHHVDQVLMRKEKGEEDGGKNRVEGNGKSDKELNGEK